MKATAKKILCAAAVVAVCAGFCVKADARPHHGGRHRAADGVWLAAGITALVVTTLDALTDDGTSTVIVTDSRPCPPPPPPPPPPRPRHFRPAPPPPPRPHYRPAPPRQHRPAPPPRGGHRGPGPRR